MAKDKVKDFLIELDPLVKRRWEEIIDGGVACGTPDSVWKRVEGLMPFYTDIALFDELTKGLKEGPELMIMALWGGWQCLFEETEKILRGIDYGNPPN